MTTTTEPSTLAQEAWAAIPGLRELESARDALGLRQVREVPPTNPVEEQHMADLTAKLGAGDGEPPDFDELGLRILDEYRALQAREVGERVRRAVSWRLHEQAQQLRIAGADDALAFLRGQLDELVADAHVVYVGLGDVASAEDAIDAGPDAVGAWKRAGELTGRYRKIRNAQSTVLRHALPRDPVDGQRGQTVARHIELAEIRDIDRLWQRWYDIRVCQLEPPPGVHAASWRPPWPTDEAARLQWLVERDALWLPSIDELLQADDAVLERAGAASRDDKPTRPVDVSQAFVSKERAYANVNERQRSLNPAYPDF